MSIQTVTVATSVEAARYTVQNADAIAAWCGGRIRGTGLEPEQRTVQFNEPHGGEADCEVGDWIVSLPGGRFARYTDDEYRAI